MDMSESVAELVQNINQIKGDLLNIYKLIQSRKTQNPENVESGKLNDWKNNE